MNFFLMLMAMFSINAFPTTKSKANDATVTEDDSSEVTPAAIKDDEEDGTTRIVAVVDDAPKPKEKDDEDGLKDDHDGVAKDTSGDDNDPVVVVTPKDDDDDDDKPTTATGGDDDTSDEPVVVPTAPSIDNAPGAIEISGDNVVDVTGGRVSTFEVADADDVASIRILDQPEAGNVTINPDNTLALVLSHSSAKEFTGDLSFTYKVTYNDGSSSIETQDLNVLTSSQSSGWGDGSHYMLQTDDDGELVIEHGDVHQKIYISGNSDAYSRQEIADIEGLNIDSITGDWLAKSDYGKTEGMAVESDAGGVLWNHLVGEGSEPGSHWMLFESGYDYEVGRLVGGASQGESELHPLYIGSYGSGDLPVLKGDLRLFQAESNNIVIRDVALGEDFETLEAGNILLDGIDANGHEIRFQGLGAHTLRDSTITDSHDDSPSGADNTWAQHADRVQGFYSEGTQGLLVEGNFFDLNGFELDYDYNLSGDFGQAPSKYSHNIYINHLAGDITLRDNIVLRGASFGAQVRPGGFIEDNVFAGNNVGVNFLGGRENEDGTSAGNYTLYTDNVVTSGGFNVASAQEGATTWGVDATGNESTLLNNIIAHLIEPGTDLDVHEGYDETQGTAAVLNATDDHIYFNDTIVYNWTLPDGKYNAEDENIDGLNKIALNGVTIENFTAALLSQTDGTLDGLATLLRANPDLVDADAIIDYFQNGFGITDGEGDRSESGIVRFVPNDLGDGIRWDNRLNWNSGDLPSTAAGDSVDLAGNWVVYGGTNTIEDLDFGSGGWLTATHGYLQVDGDITIGAKGADLDINNAGQVWIDGYSDNDRLDVDVDGGRFANTGDVDGAISVDAGDNAQVILASDDAVFSLEDGSLITVSGSDVDIGFDGEDGDVALLEVEAGAHINFFADENGFSAIGEFRSGHFDGSGPDVQSGIALNGGVLGLDLTGLGSKATQSVLLAGDEIVGAFDDVEIIGLGNDRDAKLVFDYESDSVSIEVTAAGGGSGDVSFEDIGNMGDASDSDELWNALTKGQGTLDETFPEPNVSEVDEFSDLLD